MHLFRRLMQSEGLKKFAAINSIQAQYLDEPCIVVNELDKPIRQISKRECPMNRMFNKFSKIYLVYVYVL